MTPEERSEHKLRGLRDYVFLKGQIPTKIALGIYVGIAAVCMGVTPKLFPGVKVYYVLIGELHFSLQYLSKVSLFSQLMSLAAYTWATVENSRTFCLH